MDCEKLPTCLFFKGEMQDMPSVASVLKKQYCLGDFERCARFRVAAVLGISNVPGDLYPSDDERAERMLAAAS